MLKIVKGPYFDNLRNYEWKPKFKWVDTIEECADYINRPHEDYPKRVLTTKYLLEDLNPSLTILSIDRLRDIHENIMSERVDAGYFRKYNVRVGPHIAPDFSLVKKLMTELTTEHYQGNDDSIIENINNLKSWYLDFETIHPFSDGNGRVGGIVVAILSNLYHSDDGLQWLAPLQ